MADATYQPKTYRDSGGDRLNVVSGGTLNVESGATETHANNPAFSGNPTFTGTPDFSGAAGVTMKAASVTAASLGANLRTGFIPISLESLREISANDIINTAGDAGVLSKNTTPILERVNGATDKALRVKWAASNSDELTFSFPYPPDLDDTAAVVVNLLAKSGGATDTPTITVGYFEGVGDTDAGGATGALSSTLAQVSRSIAAGDVGAYPAAASVSLTPGAHTTDTVEIYGVWITYTRKT